jgi:hypothetical protein
VFCAVIVSVTGLVCDWFSYGVVPIWDHIILLPVSSTTCLGMYVATPALPVVADICGALRLAASYSKTLSGFRRHYLCMFSLSGIVYGEA